MQFVTVRHLWGVPFEHWSLAFPKIKANGYSAVESPAHLLQETERQTLKKLCAQYDLKLVYQIHTDSYAQHPKKDKTVEGHLKQFKNQLFDAQNSFGDILLFVNSHSGYDGWGQQQREEFFTGAMAIQESFTFEVAHETHRARVMYNPWVTAELVNKFPGLKITADLSHWFNVLGRKLDDEMEIIQAIAPRVHHIHGRVGHSEGPQVPDPNSPLWSEWLEAHERCWDTIWTIRAQRGEKVTFFEPEFGPPPYAWVTGYGHPQVNVWDVCEWVTKRETQRFKDKFSK